MTTLRYKITIDAPRKQVWDTMLQPQSYRQWVNASWPGSFYEGSWKEGETIKFSSKDGSGTIALIEAFKPYEFILAKHIAVMEKGGTEDRGSEIAKSWIGTQESYSFTERDRQTELLIEIKTAPEWEKMFNDGWPAALQKLKEISETVPA